MLIVFACMSYVVVKSVEQAMSILDRLDVNSGAVDINSITNAATQASESSGGSLANIALLLIFACWIFGIVDAYAMGNKMDNK